MAPGHTGLSSENVFRVQGLGFGGVGFGVECLAVFILGTTPGVIIVPQRKKPRLKANYSTTTRQHFGLTIS